jgi:hypothetical protein
VELDPPWRQKEVTVPASIHRLGDDQRKRQLEGTHTEPTVEPPLERRHERALTTPLEQPGELLRVLDRGETVDDKCHQHPVATPETELPHRLGGELATGFGGKNGYLPSDNNERDEYKQTILFHQSLRVDSKLQLTYTRDTPEENVTLAQ